MATGTKMRFLLGCAVLFALAQPAYGQFEKDYEPLSYRGKIPDAFLEKSSSRIAEKMADRQELELTRKQSKEFLASADFALQRVLTGGNVLFNDSISSYLQEISDKLLQNDPELREKLKVYILRVPVVNAFSWQDGTLFFTLGMLQRLENEGQLAFIMGHEISHYEYKHSLQKYKRNKQLFKSNIFGRADETESLLLSRSYSREKEEEADRRGLELALKAGYDHIEAINTLRMLDSAHVPIPHDSLEIDTFFSTMKAEFAAYGFKEEKTSKKGGKRKVIFKSNPEKSNYRAKDDEDDEESEDDTLSEEDFSTHPAIPARISYIEETMAGKADEKQTGRSLQHMQDIASFEIIEFHWRQKDLVNTIRHSMILQQKFPQNSYLHAMITKSLWWSGYYQTYNALGEVFDGNDYNDKGEQEAIWKQLRNNSDKNLYRYAYIYGKNAVDAGEFNEELILYTARAAEQAGLADEAVKLYGEYLKSFPQGRHANFVKAKL